MKIGTQRINHDHNFVMVMIAIVITILLLDIFKTLFYYHCIFINDGIVDFLLHKHVKGGISIGFCSSFYHQFC